MHESGFLTTGFAVLGLALVLAFSCAKSGDKTPPYRNPALSIDERVNDLLSRMTLEEKISQMCYDAPAIEHLGIPKYNWWNECLHGVARAGVATVFPQAIGLAATWDTELMRKAATVISDEARAKHHEFTRRGERDIYKGLTFWSPNINIFRDPRWGRGQETYGEDPYLTSRMGVEFVKGLQGDDPRYLKLVSTPKHYAVHSGPEPERHKFDARVSERDLRETYLPAFQATVTEGRAVSVMCAYNRFMGAPCCGSPKLLMDILRKEWGFQGYVVSDCWALRDFYQGHKVTNTAEESAALAAKSGCDLNCGDVYRDALFKAVKLGLVTENEVDTAVKRLFTARFRLGMFDPPEMVAYARIPYQVNDCQEHRDLALRTARESIVLVKNEKGLLPLRKDLKAVGVIGPNADVLDVLLGNYNGTPSKYVTVFQGIREKVSPGTEVLYSRGCEPADSFITLEDLPLSTVSAEGRGGLRMEIFSSPDLSGPPVLTAIDTMLHHDWHENWPGLAQLKDKEYSIRWTGAFTPPVSGRYRLGVDYEKTFRLFLDNRLVSWRGARELKPGGEPGAGTALSSPALTEIATLAGEIELAAGKSYVFRLETLKNSGNTVIFLKWALPSPHTVKEVLKKAEVVIMCLGLTPLLEGEEMSVTSPGFHGGDRTSLDLPRPQEELLERVAASGKPVVLVLLNGSALAVNWADKHIPAIVDAWYPGEEGGQAVADVIFGDYNPAGRLPVTFYKSVNDLPPFEDYNMEGRTYRYFRGQPLYPFGHGLSYTRFSYSGLAIEPARIQPGDSVKLTVQVENTGKISGDEVVQVYLTDKEAAFPVPIRALKGFKRISLEPGEKKNLSFFLAPRDMSVIDNNGRRVIEPGKFVVTVGGKQPGFSGTADAATTMTLEGSFEVEGKVTEVK